MAKNVDETVKHSYELFVRWKNVPAPQRGELIRVYGNVLRTHKETLSRSITTAIGKTIRESRGEIQEVIDMCDFATGLSRQMYGLTMPSERPDHRIQEQWLPLGPVGVITAFNFPAAVWGWNFCLATICGDTTIWKPSEHAVTVADLMNLAWAQACTEAGMTEFKDISQVIDADMDSSIALVENKLVPLISATGSVKMGRDVGARVAARLGRSLLELGGNNAAVVSEKCDLDLAVRGCVFGAVGTTGQRCTSLRRVFVHESIIDEFVKRMIAAYKTIKIGNPMDESVLIGPLLNQAAYTKMEIAINEAVTQAGRYSLLYGGNRLHIDNDDRVYVEPAIIRTDKTITPMSRETFAPILYVMPYNTIGQAIALVNFAYEGLSSSIFTNDVRESELFMRESVTGLVNVNTGTSGAEIGGAFGGEKDTGGGRESGSDAWKNYMRRATSTINFSGEMPLAQGIVFE